MSNVLKDIIWIGFNAKLAWESSWKNSQIRFKMLWSISILSKLWYLQNIWSNDLILDPDTFKHLFCTPCRNWTFELGRTLIISEFYRNFLILECRYHCIHLDGSPLALLLLDPQSFLLGHATQLWKELLDTLHGLLWVGRLRLGVDHRLEFAGVIYCYS